MNIPLASNKKNAAAPKKKNPFANKNKLFIRILAWILVLMMIITGVYTALYFFISTVFAADASLPDLKIAVGLLYGDNVDVAFKTTTTNGYIIGTATIEKYKKTFTPLWSTTEANVITIVCDRNNGKKSNTYFFSDTSVAVGEYHLQIDTVYKDAQTMAKDMAVIDAALSDKGIYSIPSYINGEYRIRVGNWGTKKEAETALEKYGSVFKGKKVTIVGASATGVSMVATSTAKILFEYDCGKTSFLALDAIDDADGTPAYLSTPSGNIYDGIFVYRRYKTSTKDGIELINVVSLEDYVAGVLPYEISNSWPLECQKTFAIAARTYVIQNMGKYWSYGFNVDSTANSQVYRGIARVNSNVRAAVAATAGQVLTYNGSLAAVYYSSSTGGCTAGTYYVWGSSGYSWLASKSTPWEDYLNHTNAFWQTEVSPSELSEYLISRGYTTIKSDIASITINETAGEESSYVYKVTVVDTQGNKITITRCDKVKSAFSKYLNSANFVVGKGSVDYTEYTALLPPDSLLEYEYPEGNGERERIFSTSKLFGVLTDFGQYLGSWLNGISVITAEGNRIAPKSGNMTVLTAESQNPIYAVSKLDGKRYDLSNLTITSTKYAKNKENFIFVGKGWGHGVGLSQYGTYDLAMMGIDYKTILTSYCPGTSLSNFANVVSWQWW